MYEACRVRPDLRLSCGCGRVCVCVCACSTTGVDSVAGEDGRTSNDVLDRGGLGRLSLGGGGTIRGSELGTVRRGDEGTLAVVVMDMIDALDPRRARLGVGGAFSPCEDVNEGRSSASVGSDRTEVDAIARGFRT